MRRWSPSSPPWPPGPPWRAGSWRRRALSAGDWGVYHDFSEWAQIPARNLDRLGALAGSQQPREPGTRETAAGLLHALLESAGLLWD